MGVGCILYRNCISRPTEVDTLGGLIFVCFFWICSMEKQLYDVVVRKMESDEEGEVLVFDNIEDAQKEANNCQNGTVVKLKSNGIR